MTKCDRDVPAYDLAEVAKLASDPKTFRLQPGPRLDIANLGLDDEDVREWFCDAVKHNRDGDFWFKKCAPTEKYPPDTCSDYYGGSVPGIRWRAYIKFAIYKGVLVVTSFKEDDDAY